MLNTISPGKESLNKIDQAIECSLPYFNEKEKKEITYEGIWNLYKYSNTVEMETPQNNDHIGEDLILDFPLHSK